MPSLSRRDRRPFLTSTPKGTDAAAFPHFCPICCCHFAAATILQTSCCHHSICRDCTTRYVRSRQASPLPLGILQEGKVFDVPCPACNQASGVRFVRVKEGEESHVRSYVESPRTKELMRRMEEAEAEQGHGQLVMVGA